MNDQLREKYGLSDQVKGVVVTKVAPNSPAAEKQLQAGDVILEVDQKPVTTPQEVTEIVAKLQGRRSARSCCSSNARATRASRRCG